jgi:hypothetical protein
MTTINPGGYIPLPSSWPGVGSEGAGTTYQYGAVPGGISNSPTQYYGLLATLTVPSSVTSSPQTTNAAMGGFASNQSSGYGTAALGLGGYAEVTGVTSSASAFGANVGGYDNTTSGSNNEVYGIEADLAGSTHDVLALGMQVFGATDNGFPSSAAIAYLLGYYDDIHYLSFTSGYVSQDLAAEIGVQLGAQGTTSGLSSHTNTPSQTVWFTSYNSSNIEKVLQLQEDPNGIFLIRNVSGGGVNVAYLPSSGLGGGGYVCTDAYGNLFTSSTCP